MTIPAPVNPFPSSGMIAKGGARACGEGRTVDSIYMECGEMLGGSPIEQFVCDPTKPFNVEQFGICATGTHTFTDHQGVTHILDWVGEQYYEYPADFIEEARQMGISRKINEHQVKRLTRASKLYLLHPKGHVNNHQEVGRDSLVICPNGQHHPGDPCAGLHLVIPEKGAVKGHRPLVNGTYEVTPRRNGSVQAQYTHGVFMIVPITNLTLIARHDGTYHQKRFQNMKLSTLPSHVSNI